MKKIICILLLLIVISGCNGCVDNSLDNEEMNTTTNENPNSSEQTTDATHKEGPFDGMSIDIRSLDEFLKMREMLSCNEEDQLKDYLASLVGAATKVGIEKLITLADDLQFVNVVEGELSWIRYREGKNLNTDKEVEDFYIAFKAENGDWIRYEYYFTEDINELYVSEDAQIFDNPIKGTSERITIHTEQRKLHPSGVGEWVIWTATIDGTSVFIHQYSTVVGQIKADDIINGNLTTCKDLK
jgi:hypothetical protein